MEEKIKIDSNLCKKCKVCIEICPNVIYEFKNDFIVTKEERTSLCFACGQCMAACAEMAIQVKGLSYEKDFYPLPEKFNDEKSFQQLIDSRRSVRAFKNKPIPKEELEKIVQAISQAPPSFPPLKTELIVVQDQDIIHWTLPLMTGMYDQMMAGLKKPIPRFFIKRAMGKEKYLVVKSHLEPLLNIKLPSMKAGTEDAIMRKASAFILFHTDKNSENAEKDIYIALAFGLLKAHSLGIGATAIDLIPPPINRMPELKNIFKIPENNEVIASMILGYPKYQYKRAIRRELKSVTWI